MKKIYFLLLALCCAGIARGQSLPDKEKIVQQCINLHDLEQLYSQTKPLYILQTNDTFGNIHPTYKGKEVVFLSKDQLKTLSPDAYFSFWIFETNEKTARVLFSYNYDLNKPENKDFKATLLMEKRGSNWIITNTKLSW